MKFNTNIKVSFLLFFFFFNALALVFAGKQSPIVDSLLNHMDLAYQNPQLAFMKIKKIYDTNMDSDNQRDRGYIELAMARSFHSLGKGKESNIHLKEADSLSQLVEDIELHLKVQASLGNMEARSQNFDKARLIFASTQEDIIALKDTSRLIDMHCHIARCYISEDKIAEGLEHALKANEINHAYGGDGSQAFIDRVLGEAYYESRDYDNAVKYFTKSVDHYKLRNKQMMTISTLINLSAAERRRGNTEIALKYLDEVKAMKIENPTNVGYYSAMMNRAVFLVDLNQFQEAKRQTLENIEYAKANDRDPTHSIYWLGVVHRGLDKYSIAEKHIEDAFERAKAKKNYGSTSFYAHALHQTYLWKDKFEPALEWYQIHTQYKDSIMSERQLKDTDVLLAKIEALEKQKEVERLEKEAAKQDVKRNQLWFAFIFAFLGGLGLFYYQRQKQIREKRIQDAEYKAVVLEKGLIEQKLDFNSKELASHLLHLAKKNTVLQNINQEVTKLSNVKEDKINHEIKRISRMINRSFEDDNEWEKFLSTFKNVHKTFLNKLYELAESLTSNDVRLASLMKMNLSSKEIASLLNITDEGVKKARYRLRKKLNLESEINVQDYLLQLG